MLQIINHYRKDNQNHRRPFTLTKVAKTTEIATNVGKDVEKLVISCVAVLKAVKSSEISYHSGFQLSLYFCPLEVLLISFVNLDIPLKWLRKKMIHISRCFVVMSFLRKYKPPSWEEWKLSFCKRCYFNKGYLRYSIYGYLINRDI